MWHSWMLWVTKKKIDMIDEKKRKERKKTQPKA